MTVPLYTYVNTVVTSSSYVLIVTMTDC